MQLKTEQSTMPTQPFMQGSARFFQFLIAAICLFIVAIGHVSSALAQPDKTAAPPDSPSKAKIPEIPYEKFTLDNGLTVIVSEDHSTPLVNVRVWYHTGAQEGPYAHLFEHLMFEGSKHAPRPWFEQVSELGASQVDAVTSQDRTNYFETVPKTALDAVLWLESDRMAHPLLTEESLTKQRKIVRNEKNMRLSQPEWQIREATMQAAYPEGHPYSQVFETEEELEGASVDLMTEWHQKYYGASNATVLLTGAIDPDSARKKVERYFGSVRPGPPVEKTTRWIAKRSERKHQQIHASVSSPRLRMVWNVPGWGSEAADYLELAQDLLGGSDGPLTRRLVEDKGVATSVDVDLRTFELGGQFIVDVTVASGADFRQVEELVQTEIDRFIQEGPSTKRLKQDKAQYELDFSKEIQRLGRWSDGKSNILARGEVFQGDPAHYKTMVRRTQNATPGDFQEAAHSWLAEGALVLEVLPEPSYTASRDSVDRSERPDAGPLPEVELPKLKQQTLSNGLEVTYAPREEENLARLQLIVESGHALDPNGASGTSKLLLNHLEKQNGLPRKLRELGAEISVESGLFTSTIELTARSSVLAPALEHLTDAVLQPSFSEEAVQEARRQQEANRKEEMQKPLTLAWHLLPPLLYEEDHPYGRSFTGTGTPESIEAVSAERLRQFYQTHYQPENATLIAAGDVSPGQTGPLLREAFGSWSGEGKAETPPEVGSPDSSKPAVYLVNRDGAERSAIFAAQTVSPGAKSNPAAYEVMRYALGGFTPQSRLMQNLREDKGWAYRAVLLGRMGPETQDPRGAEPIVAYAPVQTDKTGEAMQEILREWRLIQEERPVGEEELSRIQTAKTMDLADNLQTLEGMGNLLRKQVAADPPMDPPTARLRDIQTLSPEDVTGAARKALRPENLIWLVIGDANEIKDTIRGLDLGDVHVLEESDLPFASKNAN